MAYAAVISLMQTIDRLLNSSRILLSPPVTEIIRSAHEQLMSLKETLKKLDGCSKTRGGKAVNGLDAGIREAVSRFEDSLDSSVIDQVNVLQSENLDPFSIDLQHLTKDMDSLIHSAKKMEEEYTLEIDTDEADDLDDDDDDDEAVPDFGGNRPKMVGLSDELSRMKTFLTNSSDSEDYVISIVDMAGMGKTTFAMELFHDPYVVTHFGHRRAWVRVGRKYDADEIARDLLLQVDPHTNLLLLQGDQKKVRYELFRNLKDESYMIVLDDVWDTQVWDYLRYSLPHNHGKGRVIVTTRLKEVARHIYHPAHFNHTVIRLLCKEEAWILLSQKVFGEDKCPPQLEKAGKMIATNCFGLPLAIIAVADLLLTKVEMKPESWEKLAEDRDFVFMDDAAYSKISKVLMPSYDYLPQYLKPCFLSMGVVPPYHEIPIFKFRDIWILEGFLEPNVKQTLKDCARQYLGSLVSNSLVMPYQTNEKFPSSEKSIKSCLIHSSLWHLCKREAGKNKFFHVLNTRADGLDEGMKRQRRLSIHNNVLLAIKDVRDSIEDKCSSTLRSVQCYGRYREYPVPICSGLRLLRILDVRRIRFYKFPMEVLKLVQLRYFSLTYNGNLPPSISKLWNLEFLIIHRHGSIKFGGALSFEPVELWDIKELNHLRIMGGRLHNPNLHTTSLKKLSTLLGVNAGICSKRILKRISKLNKLGIRIELVPGDESRPLNALNRLSRLRGLKSLQCIVVNPEALPEFVAPAAPVSMFPSNLRKLRLNGLGYAWEHINIIGSLPNLEVLKLRCYAFRGPKCEIQRKKFLKLRLLSIEDSDVVEMNIGSESLPELTTLSLNHCYKMEDLGWESGLYLGKVEIFFCNPAVGKRVQELKEIREKTRTSRLPSIAVVAPDGNVHMIPNIFM